MPASSSATRAKNIASVASSRSLTVCCRINSVCVRILLTRSSGRAPAPPGGGRMPAPAGSLPPCAQPRPPRIRLRHPFGIQRGKGNVCCRRERLAHVAVAGIAHQPHHLEAIARDAVPGLLLEPLADRIRAAEALPGERLVDDRDAGIASRRHAGPCPSIERNAHGPDPARRYRQEVAEHLGGRAVDPDETVPAVAAQAAGTRTARRSRRRERRAGVPTSAPRPAAGWGRCAVVSRTRSRSGENPVG